MANFLTTSLHLPWDGAITKAASLLTGSPRRGGYRGDPITSGHWVDPGRWGDGWRNGGFDYGRAVGDPTLNAIVWACLRCLAEAVPEPPLRLYQPNAQEEMDALPNTAPAAQLIRRPNPIHTWDELAALVAIHEHTDGNAYLWKSRSAAGRVVQLWPLSPRMVAPVPGGTTSNYIDHYAYKPNERDEPQRLETSEVVHLILVRDLDAPWRGLSPLRSVLKHIFTDEEATAFLNAMLRNYGVPGALITPDPAAGPGAGMNEEQAQRFKAKFMASSGGDHRGEPMVSLAPLKIALMSFNPQQMLLDTVQATPEARICVVPDTDIMTKRGIIPIAEVAPGDEVVTHRGRWRRVTEVYCNPSAGRSMVEVRANGFVPLRSTADHPVYAAEFRQTRSHGGELHAFQWKAAGELRPRRRGLRGNFDALTMPMLAPSPHPRPSVRLSAYLTSSRISVSEQDGRLVHAMPQARTLPAQIELSPALGRLLGYYLAEGSQGAGKVIWYFADHEEAYRTQVLTDLRDVFGLEGMVKKTATTTPVIVQSALLARFFACGTARTKRIPAWAWAGDDDFRRAVLESWIDGDGCRSGTRVAGSTRSRDLAWGMRLLALGAGHIACLSQSESLPATIDGRFLPGGTVYVVRWHEARSQPTRYAVYGHHLVSYVRSVEPIAYDGPVYNLEVEEDHSYLTTGGMVHNCGVLGVPPIMALQKLGLEKATYSNADQFAEGFTRFKLVPYWRLQAAQLTHQLLPDFYGDDSEIVFDHDLSKVQALQEDENAKVTRLVAAVTGGVMMPNEARRQMALPEIPGGDVLFVPGSVTPTKPDNLIPKPPPPPVASVIAGGDGADLLGRPVVPGQRGQQPPQGQNGRQNGAAVTNGRAR